MAHHQLRINADEFAQANVTYPLGVSNGSGNIGFPGPSAAIRPAGAEQLG